MQDLYIRYASFITDKCPCQVWTFDTKWTCQMEAWEQNRLSLLTTEQQIFTSDDYATYIYPREILTSKPNNVTSRENTHKTLESFGKT